MEEAINICCIGDIMPSGILYGNPNICIDSSILEYMSGFDYRIGTLECALGDTPHFDEEKMRRKKDIVYARPVDIFRIKAMGIDLVSLANNHSYDLGERGLVETMAILDENNIAHIGAGMNIDEASKPHIASIKGKTIGFLGFCDFKDETCGYIPIAKVNTPGINPMEENHVKESIIKLRKNVDYVIVMMHWGKEHSYYPLPSVNNLAHKMLKWGVDVIVGDHPHCIQPYKVHHNKGIFYSLGNGFFPNRYLNKPRPTWYPQENEDTSKYPRCYGYPYVEEPTLKLWKDTALIGMLGSIFLLNDTVKLDSKLIKMNDNGYLQPQVIKYPNPYKIAGHTLCNKHYYSLFYNSMWFYLRVINKIKHLKSQALKQL